MFDSCRHNSTSRSVTMRDMSGTPSRMESELCFAARNVAAAVNTVPHSELVEVTSVFSIRTVHRSPQLTRA